MNDAVRQESAQQLVEAYSDMLLRVGYTWFGNPYDAQDICQTVLLKRMEYLGVFATYEQEKSWLLRVAINACKTLKRSAWFRRTVGLEEGVISAVELPEEDGQDLFAQVQRLPSHYRQVIFLRYYEGYAVKEIAEILGKSPNLISKYLMRARMRLKNELGGNLDE